MTRIIGLLAGSGEVPYKIIAHCAKQGIPLFIVAFEGQADPKLVQGHPYACAQLGEIGKILGHLKAHHVTHIIMAGGIRRPAWSELKLDWKGTQWLAKMGMKALGDDGLLRNVISLLEGEGFSILRAADLLDDLLAPEGILGTLKPDREDWQDIERGKEILKRLGVADVGQSVVIQQGLVLGIEAIEGTEALLARCGQLRRKGRGGALIKMVKTRQSHDVDLPTIGEDTVHQAQAAGLRGIAVSAYSTQVLNRQEVVKAADSNGLYVVGIPSL